MDEIHLGSARIYCGPRIGVFLGRQASSPSSVLGSRRRSSLAAHAWPGVRGLIKGIWHSHIGWLLRADKPDVAHYVKDLMTVRSLRIADRLFPLWVVLGLLIPGVIGGLINRSWEGFATGVIWGGLVRIFLVHHVTWSINSACHLWGTRTYACNDESRDNFIFGILAFGEGWHNTHHTFPTSARHGLRWWQLDLSYALIRLLAWLHLAWNVKLPGKEARAARARVLNVAPSLPHVTLATVSIRYCAVRLSSNRRWVTGTVPQVAPIELKTD